MVDDIPLFVTMMVGGKMKNQNKLMMAMTIVAMPVRQ